MADSKQCGASLMIAAMAWRVKYRKTDEGNKVVRKRLRVENLGVHPKNRGGVYPSGVRCKSLCVEVMDVGFIKEEVNHAVVAVEETPAAHIRSRGEEYVSGSTYNVEKCMKDELLNTCFNEPVGSSVQHMLLSHNHITLVMRAFLTKAQWDLAPNAEKGISFCDDKGRLSLTAVAEHTNGKELGELIVEGIDCEILSWKMDAEEPTAASVISQALNTGQDLALRTTELTAVAVLTGEIIVQMSKDAGQRVAFQTVRDRVRQQLRHAADDPDLPEVFDFLISLGVGKNSYIDELLEFGSCFVDSKKRQLRFSAFAVVCKICIEAPLTKVAIMKRAYRKKPIHGFCPSPELHWAEITWDRLQKLEELLRLFHATFKPQLDKMPPQLRNKLLANIDVTATDTFFATESSKQKVAVKVMEASLLRATQKFLGQLGMEGYSDEDSWIDFTASAESDEADAESALEATKGSAASVIGFDEVTGAQLNHQLQFLAAPKETNERIALPWREWHGIALASDLGAMAADKDSAVAVLHSLHENFDVVSQKIDVFYEDKRQCVVTTTKVPAGEIMLPPCIPKLMKVIETTDHPYAVILTQRVMTGSEEALKLGLSPLLRERRFFLLPEFKFPKKKERVFADAECDIQMAPEWIWNQNGEDTMHPFWAVRRLTAQQLARAKLEVQPGRSIPRFNCELVIRSISSVCVGAMDGHSLNRTRIFEVPFLTNSEEVMQGEELILEILEQRKELPKASKRRSWRDALKEEEKAALKDGETKKRRDAVADD
jgi:hypothetical protein